MQNQVLNVCIEKASHDFINYSFNLSPKRQRKFECITREFVSEASRTNKLMDLCRKQSVQLLRFTGVRSRTWKNLDELEQ